MTDVTRLRLWNNSMTLRLRDCSATAQSWIRMMVDTNKQTITEHELTYVQEAKART